MEALIIGLLFYFIPAICALNRKHNNTAAIVCVNVLLGWTVIGWIGAMVWSLTDNRKLTSKE
jgi:nucleoside recognition membrane protein YjiH